MRCGVPVVRPVVRNSRADTETAVTNIEALERALRAHLFRSFHFVNPEDAQKEFKDPEVENNPVVQAAMRIAAEYATQGQHAAGGEKAGGQRNEGD
jgi:hypothetical protein